MAAVEEFHAADELAIPGSGHWDLVEEYADPRAPGAAERVVAHLLAQADPAVEVPGVRVACDYLWLLDDGPDGPDVVGFLALRHSLTDFLLRIGGHVGYSVRPGRRREGHASRALLASLDRAHELGIGQMLVTCDEDNLASAGTAERAGGVLEDVREGKRRYWLDVPGGARD